jgi:2-methylfumaryl-CoA hydratase
VFGKTVNDVSLNAVANLGYADVRFLAPVYAGDTLRATSTVIGVKENSNGKTGVVWVRTIGSRMALNASPTGDVPVLEYTRWVMVHKRDHAVATGRKDVPDLPQVVAPDRLSVPTQLDFGRFPGWASGGARFGDFEVGERIDHIDGMTIEESEHALATRLYQNTAKVHFDAHAMKDSRFGKRLMYGGHVISICRALSFNGLENAVLTLAFNGGTHANPTFAGDTLYAYSEVLDAQPLPGRDDCGAVRLRLVGVKNQNPAHEPIETMVEKDGKRRHHPNVVLDLDHWVLVPR